MFEARRPDAHRPDQELDLSGGRVRVGDGKRPAQVGANPLGDLQHDELSGRDRAREGRRMEGRGEEAGGEFLAADEAGFVIGPQRSEFYATTLPVLALPKCAGVSRRAQRWIRNVSTQDGRNLNAGISGSCTGYFLP